MKKLIVVASMLAVATLTSNAQLAPTNQAGIMSTIGGWLMSNDPNATNLYSPKEVSIKLGMLYSQNTGEAGALLSLGQVGLIAPNVGFGFSIVEKNNGTAAFWGYMSYRKVIGNVAGTVFAGAGFDKEKSAPLGVIGGEVEYRLQAHLGSFVSLGYGIESFDNKNNGGRGLVVGAGIKYNF